MSKRNTVITTILVVVVLVGIVYTQLTIFIIPPIGAIPEGKTLIISRLNKTEFIDSADAMCERLNEGVTLLCRAVFLGAVVNKATIYLKLPYSHWLYLISTGGKIYEK